MENILSKFPKADLDHLNQIQDPTQESPDSSLERKTASPPSKPRLAKASKSRNIVAKTQQP